MESSGANEYLKPHFGGVASGKGSWQNQVQGDPLVLGQINLQPWNK